MSKLLEVVALVSGPYGVEALGTRHIMWLIKEVQRYKRMKEELIASFFACILIGVVGYSINTFTDPSCTFTGNTQVVALLESNGHKEVRLEDEYYCTKPMSSYKSWRIRH